MMRVLHLLGADADLQTQVSVRTLCANGNGAALAGESRTMGRRGGWSALAWTMLALRRDVQRFDVVHAWDRRALSAAVFAGARRIVFTAPAALSRRELSAVARAARRRTELHIVCTTPAQLRFANTIFAVPQRCHVIAPPMEWDDSHGAKREQARRALKLRDDEFVLLASGESTRAAAHERAVWTTSLLHVTDEGYRIILWGRGARFHAAAGLGEKLRQPGLVVVPERMPGSAVDFAELLPAADALLVAATGPVPVLPIAMAMSAGVPVVSVARPELAELVIEGETALTVPTSTPRLLAQRVLDLRSDAGAAAAMAARARENVRELFSPQRFLEHYGRLYDQSFGARVA